MLELNQLNEYKVVDIGKELCFKEASPKKFILKSPQVALNESTLAITPTTDRASCYKIFIDGIPALKIDETLEEPIFSITGKRQFNPVIDVIYKPAYQKINFNSAEESFVAIERTADGYISYNKIDGSKIFINTTDLSKINSKYSEIDFGETYQEIHAKFSEWLLKNTYNKR